MRNREFVFTPKIEYKLAAERATSCVRTDALGSEANQQNLTFPYWCPRQESNLDLKFRKLPSCPLNDRGALADSK